MKKLIILAAVAVLGCVAAMAKTTYGISKFSEIEIAGPVSVDMMSSSAANLVINTDNLRPGELIITSKGKSLDIKLKTNPITFDDKLVVIFNGDKKEFPASKANRNKPVRISVNNPAAVTDVEIAGSASLSAPSLGGKGKDIEVGITGSGRVKTNSIYALALDVEVSGSGMFHVADLNVSSVESEVTGSGSIVIDKANVTDVSAEISGSGSTTISNARMQSADLEITGSGSVKVSGMASRASYSISGSGKIDASLLNVRSVIKAEVVGSGMINYSKSCPDVRKKGHQNNIIGK